MVALTLAEGITKLCQKKIVQNTDLKMNALKEVGISKGLTGIVKFCNLIRYGD